MIGDVHRAFCRRARTRSGRPSDPSPASVRGARRSSGPCIITWKRSASKPGRSIARHASMLPSGENTGCASQAGLSAVRLRGSPPSTRTSYRSKFVDHGSDLPLTRAREHELRCRRARTCIRSASPNGLEGTSASSVAVSASGSPCAGRSPSSARTAARCGRPSRCPNAGRTSGRRPCRVAFDFALASSRSRCKRESRSREIPPAIPRACRRRARA